ncbi:unnamed protein product [Tuber aestivum]|uniref:Uncharacterized protein n=1 Tax=Tuber aestivum TaxID=59557 RepID=A0A292PWJ2_9PEZI|nr:unnamed protein product [Tuber aestivum]
MLECGVHTDVLDRWRNTVIFRAVAAGRWDLLQLLVEWPGVVAGIQKLGDGISHMESFQLLLHLLLTNRLGLFTELIATNRLDLHHGSRESRTILHEAVRIQALPFVEVLLAKQDIGVNFPDAENQTPLHVAAAVSTDPAIIRLLLGDSRVDCSWADSKGRTALQAAVANGNLVSVETLLADPRCQFSQQHLLNEPGEVDGMTALHPATPNSCHNIVPCLLAQLEINDLPIDRSDHTPPRPAVEAGDLAAVLILHNLYVR